MAYFARIKSILNVIRTGAGFGDYGAGITADCPNIDTTLGEGTGSSQFDRWLYDSRSLGAGANEDLDLQTILDAAGVALGLAEVRFIRIECDSGNNGPLEYKASAATGWLGAAAWTKDVSDIMSAPPGGAIQYEGFINGSNVVAAGSKCINIKNTGAGAGVYRIHILGCSA